MISLVAVESWGWGVMTMTLPEDDNTQQSSGIFTLIIYCVNANDTDGQTGCESNKTLKLLFPSLTFYSQLRLAN